MKTIQEILRNKLFYVIVLSCLGVVFVAGAIVRISVSRSLDSGAEMENFIELDDFRELEGLEDETVVVDTRIAGILDDEEKVLAFQNDAPRMTEENNETEDLEDTAEMESETLTVEEANNESATEGNSTNEASQDTAFTDDDLIWPLDGDIVMDYSMDRTIYDKTLDQYRTNDTICIAASVGTQVKAASGGTVKTVGQDEVRGYYVVIDHGNGLLTTYGQLQKGILVEEGERVSTGQVIGGVGNPTKYSILLGDHLSFSTTTDSGAVDPKTILAADVE